MKAAMTTMCLFSYIWICILSCLMNSTQSTDCSHTKPYKCQLLPQSNKSLKFPCIVQNNVGCQVFKEQVPPKDLQLNTVHIVSINIYNITYSHQDNYFYGETYPALNYTISLPNGDMLESCLAVRVNIWNNEANSEYGGDGICRLFDFNISTLSKKNIQPAYINHKCFTAIVAKNYFLKFTTLPYTTEIIYSIIISHSQIILAVAPVHHRLAISIILGVPVTNICKNQFHLTSFKTATENIKFSTNNSFLFENLQPGFYRVKVESSCLAPGQNIESEIIRLKNISEAESFFHESILILLSLLPSIIIFICLYLYFLRKRKCIDRSHKCVIDLLYADNIKTDVIVADHLKKLMEEEFEWSVNNVPVNSCMTCACELPTNDVALYLTASDRHGRVMFPHHYPIIKDIHTSGNDNVIKALLYYTQQNRNQISVDFQPSFDIVKDVKKLFYFVYRATKSKSQAELFDETHYPSVNYIGKLKSWNRFVDFIENVAELNNSHRNACSISARLTVNYDNDTD